MSLEEKFNCVFCKIAQETNESSLIYANEEFIGEVKSYLQKASKI